MVSVSPWSVKGVEPEAREAAKIAARRAGMTLGQWLNQTIRRTAAEQLARPDRPSQEMAEVDATAPANGRAANGSGETPPGDAPYRTHPPAPTAEALFESIRRLTSRIEETETKTKETVAPLASRVEELTEEVERVKAQSSCVTAPVERAILRLSERLERIEGPNREARDGRGWSLFGRSG